MVADICGLHAQVMSSAELAAAVRVDGLRPGTVAGALWSDRSLVKSWAMRGTLHLLTTEDYPLYAAALSNRRFDLDGPWLKYHGLLAADVPALVDAVADALDGRQLTREELGREVVRLLGDSKWEALLASGWGAVLKPVAFQGRLCFGPSEGNRVTFVRPDQWLGPFERLDPVESLAEVARRFLTAYGPARVEEFARWWGVQPKAVRPVPEHRPRLRAGGGRGREAGVDRAGRDGRAHRRRAGRAPAPAVRPLHRRRAPERGAAVVGPGEGPRLPEGGVDLTGAPRRRGDRRRLGAQRAGWPPPRGDQSLRSARPAASPTWRRTKRRGWPHIWVVSADITVGGFGAGHGRKNPRRSSTRREAPA